MKLFVVVLALIASVACDVSHLNNMYLPPVRAGAAGGDSFGFGAGGSAGAGFAGGSAGAGFAGGSAGGDEGAYSTQHQSFEYTQQAGEAPAASDADSYSPAEAPSEPQPEVSEPAPIGGDPITFGNIEPAQSSDDVQSAPVDGGANQFAGQDDAPGSVSGEASQFVSQNYEVDNSLTGDSYGNANGGEDALATGAAAQGPAIRAPLPAASAQDSVAQYVAGSSGGSGGIDTKYGSNGGYIY